LVKPLPRLRLQGFNNLTKSLSFNIYDICYASSEEQRQRYIEYIDEVYNAERLTQILTEVANIIGANVLNVARQEYDPHGASVSSLISEEPTSEKKSAGKKLISERVVYHTAQLYPQKRRQYGWWEDVFLPRMMHMLPAAPWHRRCRWDRQQDLQRCNASKPIQRQEKSMFSN